MEYFGRCYEICSKLNNAAALYSARVQFGVAKGHQFMGNFSALVTDPSASSLQKLVVWKDARVASVQQAEPQHEATEHLGEGQDIEERGNSGEKQVDPEAGEKKEENDVEETEGKGSSNELPPLTTPLTTPTTTSAEATAEQPATDPDLSFDHTPTT